VNEVWQTFNTVLGFVEIISNKVTSLETEVMELRDKVKRLESQQYGQSTQGHIKGLTS